MKTQRVCTSCGGLGYNTRPSIMPDEPDEDYLCGLCGGNGWIYGDEEIKKTDGGKKGGCFAAATRVLSPQGWRAIGSIEAGDEVLSVNKEGLCIACKVKKKQVHTMRRTIQVCTENQSFSVTPVHLIKSASGQWKRADKLRLGESILYLNKNLRLSEHKIIGLEAGVTQQVFNLRVERECVFITEACIAHSFAHCRVLRSLLAKIFDGRFSALFNGSFENIPFARSACPSARIFKT